MYIYIYEGTPLKSVDLFSLGAAGVVPRGERLRRIASDAKLQSVAPLTPWQGSSPRPSQMPLMQARAIVEVAVISRGLRLQDGVAKKRLGHEIGEPPAGELQRGFFKWRCLVACALRRFAARCKILGRIGPHDISGAEIRTAISTMPWRFTKSC
jgi:hypothetical protein